MPTETTDFVTDMFKQTSESFTKAMQVGAKFQEDAARFWTETAGKNFDEFRSYFEKMTQDAIPASKKNLDQFHRLFDEHTRKSFDLLSKTFEAGCSSNIQDMHEKTLELWRASFDSLRATADALAKANTEMFEGWRGLFRMGWTPGNGKTGAKATNK